MYGSCLATVSLSSKCISPMCLLIHLVPLTCDATLLVNLQLQP